MTNPVRTYNPGNGGGGASTTHHNIRNLGYVTDNNCHGGGGRGGCGGGGGCGGCGG